MLSLGYLLLALLPEHPSTANILWRMTLCGLGFGFFQSPNNRAIVASAPRERSGGAGAIQSTARLLGQTIGAALVALIFGFARPGAGAGPHVAILLAAGFSALAAVASVSRLFNFVRAPRLTPSTNSTQPDPHSSTAGTN